MAILQAKQSGPSAQGREAPSEEEAVPKLPTSVNFIVGNEFCERFSYYGMRTVLALYLVDHLHQSEEQATEFLHLFIVACYMTPLLGAFISDSYIGKYRTILYLSLVYCLGNWAMAASALHSQAPRSASLTILGLGLIALGTGGIKPCVSAFGGDQIELSYPPSSARNTLLRRFFSAFYFSINAGAVLSTLITPLIRSYSSYAWAFAVPAWLMMLSLALFYLGSGSYKHQPPGGNVVAHVAGVIWTALRLNAQRGAEQPALPEANPQPQKAPRPPPSKAPHQSKPIGIGAAVRFSNFIGGNSLRTASIFLRGTPPETRPEQQALLSGADSGAESGSSLRGANNIPVPRPPSRRNLTGEIGAQALPPAGPARTPPGGGVPAGQVAKRHWLDAAKAVHGAQDVEDVKGLLKVLLLFVPAPLFWSLFDQQSSRWVFQARKLDGRLPFGLVIEPDQMQVLNAMFILIMIPIFDRGIYPFLERRGVSLRPIRRMVVGMFIAAVAFVLSAILQIALDHGSPEPAEGLTSSLGGLTSSLGGFVGNGTVGLGTGRGIFGGADLAGWGKWGHGGKGGHGGEYQRLSMLWQVPQYVVLTAGEILFSITGLELAYSQAPSNMTAVVQSAWLLSVAAGNLVTVLVVGIIGNRLSLANEFFFFAGGCIVAMLALKFVGRGFEYAGARQPRKESPSGPSASAATRDVEQGSH